MPKLMNQSPSLCSEVFVTPIFPPRNTLVAFCSVLYRSEIRLSDIALHITQSGFALAFPAKKLSSTTVNIFYPISSEISNVIKAAIVEKYLMVTNQDANNDK